MKNRIFVVGATGSQGGAIAKFLIKTGNEVITLSNSVQQEEVTNIQIVKGGLENKDALRIALKDADKAVYTYPLIFDRVKAKELTANFITVATELEIPLVVFNAGFDLAKEETGALSLDLKKDIYAQFENSKLNVITVVPDVYLDNLAAPWSIPVINENGILPYPIEAGEKIPWISHEDLARYTVSALDKPELAGELIPIVGGIYSGEEIAAEISNNIGKEITFVPVQPDDFEKQLAPAFGELAAREISNIYRYVAKNKEGMRGKDFSSSQTKLGVTPSSLKDWVNSVNWAG